MFVTEESRVRALFTEVCYNGDPFRILVRETRGGETRELSTAGHRPWHLEGTDPR